MHKPGFKWRLFFLVKFENNFSYVIGTFEIAMRKCSSAFQGLISIMVMPITQADSLVTILCVFAFCLKTKLPNVPGSFVQGTQSC